MAAAEPRAYSVQEAVQLIHQAGGVASLAHPAKIKRSQPLLSHDDLADLMAAGFDAIEAWQWISGGWGSQHYLCLSGELGVLVSGGSVDRGKRAPDRIMRIGAQPAPVDNLAELTQRALDLRPA